MASPSEETPSSPPRPVHQIQQYYRLGTLDNCADKWSALYDCSSFKTKCSSEVQEILEAREKAKTHIWTLRGHRRKLPLIGK